VATPEEFTQALYDRVPKSDFAIVTPVPVLVRELLSRLETPGAPRAVIPVDEVSSILAPHVGKLGYLRALRGELSDALTLDANYVRRSDAELHWKDPGAS
jgi:hypothetical protein